MSMSEMRLYAVRDGRIAKEEFFYRGLPQGFVHRVPTLQEVISCENCSPGPR